MKIRQIVCDGNIVGAEWDMDRDDLYVTEYALALAEQVARFLPEILQWIDDETPPVDWERIASLQKIFLAVMSSPVRVAQMTVRSRAAGLIAEAEQAMRDADEHERQKKIWDTWHDSIRVNITDALGGCDDYEMLKLIATRPAELLAKTCEPDEIFDIMLARNLTEEEW